MSILETLRDKVGHDVPCPGLWVLVATDGQNDMPMLDHAEIPLITPGQRAKVSEAWIDNVHRGRAEPVAALAVVGQEGRQLSMVNIKTLLPELEDLVTELAEDLLARVDSGCQDRCRAAGSLPADRKGGRTAQAFEVWRDDYLDQVAVAWVLACVFVRFMEDNHLIDECWLAGEGDRRKLAEDTHELFFRKHPHDTDREYFQHVFHEVGKIPAAKELFAEGKTPLWAVAPSGDAAMKLLDVLAGDRCRRRGICKRSFEVENGDTRFLGDLYQELLREGQEEVRPAANAGVRRGVHSRPDAHPGPRRVRAGEGPADRPDLRLGALLARGVRPALSTCGCKRESNEIVAAQKALDGVWGVDINPFAVAIARFRLIVAAVQACGIKQAEAGTRLDDSPGYRRQPAVRQQAGAITASERVRSPTRESVRGHRRSMPSRIPRRSKRSSAKAITSSSATRHTSPCKDQSSERAYRELVLDLPQTILPRRAVHRSGSGNWRSSHGEGNGRLRLRRHDYRQLVHEAGVRQEADRGVLPQDRPHPRHRHFWGVHPRPRHAHGNPLRTQPQAGRRYGAGSTGNQGRANHAGDAFAGLVWQSIVKQIDRAEAQDEFTSTADVPRTTFNSHPWSIGGGGAAELKEMIEENAKDHAWRS